MEDGRRKTTEVLNVHRAGWDGGQCTRLVEEDGAPTLHLRVAGGTSVLALDEQGSGSRCR